jgi:hypothetical protein
MCEKIKLATGDSLLVCGLRTFRKFCACGRHATLLCDWKVSTHKTGTCDRPICAHHGKQVSPGKHLCPLHQKHFDDWKKKHPGRTFSVQEQLALFGEAV